MSRRQPPMPRRIAPLLHAEGREGDVLRNTILTHFKRFGGTPIISRLGSDVVWVTRDADGKTYTGIGTENMPVDVSFTRVTLPIVQVDGQWVSFDDATPALPERAR